MSVENTGKACQNQHKGKLVKARAFPLQKAEKME
jgi:hypothetical protein